MQQIIGVAGMVLCFVLSSFLVFQEKMMGALWAGGAAALFFGFSILDLEQIKQRLGSVRGKKAEGVKAPSAKPLKGARAQARASAKSAALPAVKAPRLTFAELVAKIHVPESIEIPWSAYLGVTIVALLLGQGLVFGFERYLLGWLFTLVSLGLFIYFWTNDQPSFRVRLIATLPLFLGNVALGVALEVAGFIAAWIQRPYLGFFLILAGTYFLVRGLWHHFELPRRQLEGPYEGLRAFKSDDDFTQRGLLIKGGAIMVALALFVAQKALASYDQIAIAMVAATLALVYSFPWSPVDIRSLDRFGVGTRRALTFCMLLMALAVGHQGQTLMYSGDITGGLWRFLAAILLVAAAVPSPTEEADNGRPGRLETYLLVALVILAFALRVYKVGEVPIGVEGDEAGYGWWSQELREGRFFQIFIHAAQSLYWYFGGATFLAIFGVNPLGIRLLSVLHGGLGILTFYLFLRLFFNWRTALVSALLLCFSLWHLHFSRFGHYNVITSFAQAILFYYMFRAARYQRLWDFIIAGVGLSIAAQSHVGARLIPIFMAAYVGYLFLFHRRAFVRLLPGIIIIIATSWILLSGPWVQFIKNPLWMLGRIKDVSITNDQNSNAPADVIGGVAQSFKASMLMFNFRGDSRARDHFMAPDPMLDHWTSILFAIGFGLAVLSWRKPLYGFALIAFFGTLLSSVMSVEAPQGLRTAGNMTFVYLLVAFTIDRIRWAFEDALPGAGKKAFLVLGVGAALYIGNQNIRAYWERARNQSFDSLSTEIGMKAQSLGPKAKLLFMSESFGYSHPPVFFFANGTPIRSTAEQVDLLPATESVEKGMLFAFSDRYKPAWKTAKLFYPEGKAEGVESWLNKGTNDYDGWWVTGEQLEAAHGFKARYKVGDKWVELKDRVAFGEGKAPLGATAAEWTGSIQSPAYCQAKVYFSTSGTATVWVNGSQVSTTYNGRSQAKEIRLPGGLSRYKITWSGQGQPGRLVWDRDPIRHLAQTYFELPMYEAGPKPVESRLSFHSIQPVGLLQHFYTGQEFKGAALVKVDPVVQGYWVSAGYGPIAWRWTGSIKAPVRGVYNFRVSDAPNSEVWIDGRLISRVGAVRDTWPGYQSSPSGPIQLGAGKHKVEVRYASPGTVNFSFQWNWTGADGTSQDWELVPADAMEPEDFLG